ncbi:hypothetical protein G4G28_13935 [Massilia sp. Dwa41.01b]|uniref:hypothetical protein n=1 Tax=Massilia sp. Dwa41.01b TaxID=2709302 RepID=UPI0016034BBB|nr:hypothetical protein [Massilia sp. Dwa41.01b]QNA89289.1 hypothetical protein G4G28_13935 [Massilia sp. Dwa41.01b]
MTFNKHVRGVVGTELGAIQQRGFTGALDARPAPRLLYLLADGPQLHEAVADGALPAQDSRFAGEAALDAYALPLLTAFIDERRVRRPAAPEYRFGEALAEGIEAAGSYFERYLVRLFEGADAALERHEGRLPYALGLRTAELDMAVHGGPQRSFLLASAIYDPASQRAILGAIFTAFETYQAAAGERFGEQNVGQVLASCWDGFRQAVAMVLPRFRPPQLHAEREWVALARWRSPTRFQLVGDLLVPALSPGAHAPAGRGLPLERTLVHGGVPQALAAEGLRQFYRLHGLPARVLAAPGMPGR